MDQGFVAVFAQGDRQHPAVSAFGRFRKEFFIDWLGWDLCQRGDEEVDEFDQPEAIYCVLFKDGSVVGGFRAISCEQNYLAETVFGHLASNRPYPRTADYIEISRFGVTDPSGRMARTNYALMFHLARMLQVRGLVAIAELAYERYLKMLGIRTERYGPPRVIGHTRNGEPIEAVAGEIPLLRQSGARFQALLANLSNVEVNDESSIFRRPSISA
jgi:acyl homoserine lactone synthase